MEHPRSKRNAWTFFVESAVATKTESVKERMINLAKLWKEMKNEDREIYEQMARDDEVRYELEFRRYEDKDEDEDEMDEQELAFWNREQLLGFAKILKENTQRTLT